MDRSKNGRKFRYGVLASGAVFGLLALGGASSVSAQGAPTAPDEVYALTKADTLLQFDGNSPNDTESTIIRGLRGNESLVGIDFRPSSQTAALQGTLYGVGNQGSIYTINEDNGRATFVTKLFAADSTGTITTPRARVNLEGQSFGVDFNPTVDRLRIVSDTDQNLRVNVETGATIVDTDLNYTDDNEGRNPWVTAAGYTNNLPTAFGMTGQTALFDVDSGLDSLVQQTNANGGTLDEIGELGPDVKLNTGFDITTTVTGDEGYAALQMKGNNVKASGFFSVDLDTGDAMSMGRINGGRTMVEGLAIPIPLDDDTGGGTTIMTR